MSRHSVLLHPPLVANFVNYWVYYIPLQGNIKCWHTLQVDDAFNLKAIRQTNEEGAAGVLYGALSMHEQQIHIQCVCEGLCSRTTVTLTQARDGDMFPADREHCFD